VNTDGRVHDCRVVKSLPFMDRAVIEALEKRRYTPATQGGKPIDVDYTFRITLRLPE
jgi:protein TonB